MFLSEKGCHHEKASQYHSFGLSALFYGRLPGQGINTTWDHYDREWAH
jgi:hypothetical protein